MKILVIAATNQEIAFTRSVNIDVAITGVGIAATTYHLQKKLQQTKYDFVIQVGIAGAFSKEFKLGATGLVQRDCFADLGIEEKGIFTSIFDANLEDKNKFPFTNKWLINNNSELLRKSSFELLKGATVSKVSDNILQTEQILQTYNPEIETMEGAAFHYVCLQENIPFAQIRSISNYVGERDKSKWKINEAIKNANAGVETLLKEISWILA
ncbi:MAG: futalosine hydrolase [Bacteroidota bacterium]